MKKLYFVMLIFFKIKYRNNTNN